MEKGLIRRADDLTNKVKQTSLHNLNIENLASQFKF